MRPREHIPLLYASIPLRGRHVLIMEYVRPAGRLTLHGLERAVLSIWGAGVVHADLHKGNIVVDSSSSVKIIDFGFAVILPAKLRGKVRQRLCTDPDTALEDPDIKRHVEMQQSRYGRIHIHWNTDALRHLKP